MSKSKVISTLTFLINNGIHSCLYYDRERHKKLLDANAFWDEDKNLCFTIGKKTYRLQVIEEKK